MTRLQGVVQTGTALRLHANHLHARIFLLHRNGQTRDQTSAAHGDNNGVHVFHLFNNFKPNCARTRDDRGVVKAMDVG